MKMPGINFNVIKYLDKQTLRNGGIMLGVILIFLFICLLPSIKYNKLLKTKHKETMDNATRSLKKIESRDTLLKEKKALEEYVLNLESRTIQERDKTTLIGDISDIARKCNATIVSMQPRVYDKKYPDNFTKFYKPLSYELVLECGYHECGLFLNTLEHFQVLLTVEELRIQPSEENKMLHTVTLLITTYAKKTA